MDIDPSKLEEIAAKVKSLLDDECGIPAQHLSLAMGVDKEYYESIKENFPDRHPSDIGVWEDHQDWHVKILYFQNAVDA